VERVQKFLEKNDVSCTIFHSGLAQNEREKALEDFRENRFKILIATDISARGIDIPNVSNVINYDLPEVSENYVHRIGRTGRGDKRGEGISFCSEEEESLLKDIENYTGYEINRVVVNEATKQKAEICALNDNKTLQQMILDEEAGAAAIRKKRRK
jgi:ATP-dependent RNA helicase RhlE